MQVVGLMDVTQSREGALSRRTGRVEAFGGGEEENGVQDGLILAAEGMEYCRHSRCLSLGDEQHSLAV